MKVYVVIENLDICYEANTDSILDIYNSADLAQAQADISNEIAEVHNKESTDTYEYRVDVWEVRECPRNT